MHGITFLLDVLVPVTPAFQPNHLGYARDVYDDDTFVYIGPGNSMVDSNYVLKFHASTKAPPLTTMRKINDRQPLMCFSIFRMFCLIRTDSGSFFSARLSPRF